MVVEKFNEIKSIFDEKGKETSFLRYINSFFKFLWPLDITGGGAGTTAFVHY